MSNASVSNGALKITAKKEQFENRNFTSTRLVSRNKGDFLYGRIEVRAIVPQGLGTWPAIWMLPTDWEYGGWPSSGEIDIMEHVGYDPEMIHMSIHTEAYYWRINTQKTSKRI
ncbi:glycoside hydrolase family 16 protein, partial [Arthrospira platensis SPKY1]|nr:glycoside hydrolase family 16 protein [Arthrospira platensis SPKY1]